MIGSIIGNAHNKTIDSNHRAYDAKNLIGWLCLALNKIAKGRDNCIGCLKAAMTRETFTQPRYYSIKPINGREKYRNAIFWKKYR
mgnify:CR=1 FL=1